MRNGTCYHCIYFSACGDVDRIEPCKGKVTEEEDRTSAKNFFADLVGTCKGTRYRWEIFTEEMADLMGITVKEAEVWERKLIKYGITERQNGGIVTNA